MLKKFRKTAKIARQYLDEKLAAKKKVKSTRTVLITGFTLHNTSEYLV
jgi:hypothetical protein